MIAVTYLGFWYDRDVTILTRYDSAVSSRGFSSWRRLTSCRKSGLTGVSSAGERSSVITLSSSGFYLELGADRRKSLNYYVRLVRISMALCVCSFVSLPNSGWLYAWGFMQMFISSERMSVCPTSLGIQHVLLLSHFIVLSLHFIHYILHLQKACCIEPFGCKHFVEVHSFHTLVRSTPSNLSPLYLMPFTFSK